MRGKIINAYKSREDKVLANEEVRSMIAAVGIGIGEDQDLSKRRYGRIVIMTDADVDGSHIRTLLLTFFYRQMYQLVAGGHVYVAQPPLFRVRNKSNTYYVQTEEEMRAQLLDLGLADSMLDPGDGRLDRRRADGQARPHAGRARGSAHRPGAPRHQPQLHAVRQDPATGRLPVYHVFLNGHEEWFTSREELDNFIAEQEKIAGGKLNVDAGLARHAPRPAPTATKPRTPPSSASSSSTKSARSTRSSPTSQSSASPSKPSSRRSAPAKRTRATCSAAAKTKPAWKTSAACPPPSAPPAKRACRSPASKASAK